MDIAHVLRDILVVLVAAKLAAEIAERVGVPAVVGEIIAGIAIGPSLLGLVGAGDEVLRTLGEIGVILLLLDVGMEMDLAELGKVGRASLLVATVGVVAPMAMGLGAMLAIGDDFNTALFVGAALTATSVGITARVFGDLRALATTEARVVLGAAVADDVMGLVVLTVVVRLVTEGSVSALSVAGIVGIAVAFLVVSAVLGLRVAPPLFAAVERISRSTGTLVALALAFTLGFAELASSAKLAPIIGAFVAGLALARSKQRVRIARELAPVGHLFIPVFFLQIGIDADVTKFVDVGVLRDAGILLVVAVIGKLLSPIGMAGTPGDRWLVGLGMLPRGEVGLIFATIGLQEGVLGADLYAALLLVVLVTTLGTPQLLKARYAALRRAATGSAPVLTTAMPAGGWLRVGENEVVLAATPPHHLALLVALEAAVLVAHARPSAQLLDWLSTAVGQPLRWDRRATDAFLRVLDDGNARSWRFLEAVGVLDKSLPELAETLRSRHADPFELDPTSTHHWATIERLRSLARPASAERSQLAHPEWLTLAALLVDGLEGDPSPVAAARQIVRRLDLGAAAEQEIAGLVEDADLLWSAARRLDGLAEESVLQLASHLDTPERARALYLLSLARGDDHERWEVDRLTELHELVQRALANAELTGLDARNLVGRRRAEAARLVGGVPHVVERIERAPRAYVLRADSNAIARQAQLLDPVPSSAAARVVVTEVEGSPGWWLDVAARDRPGLLAAVTAALAAADLDVRGALVATWSDGAALESFLVDADEPPDAAALCLSIQRSIGQPLAAPPLADAIVNFDDGASPWHTVCEITAPDKPGLLHALATAFAASGVEVQAARVGGDDGMAVDRFEVTDRAGAKLDEDLEALVRRFVHGGVVARRRPIRRSFSFTPVVDREDDSTSQPA
jgi:Kef-type K+ transport system membrane component KefB/predicted amino acid-binding ACT domain protein